MLTRSVRPGALRTSRTHSTHHVDENLLTRREVQDTVGPGAHVPTRATHSCYKAHLVEFILVQFMFFYFMAERHFREMHCIRGALTKGRYLCSLQISPTRPL